MADDDDDDDDDDKDGIQSSENLNRVVIHLVFKRELFSIRIMFRWFFNENYHQREWFSYENYS